MINTLDIRINYADLGSDGQAFLMFEMGVCNEGKNATFQLLLDNINCDEKMTELRKNICIDFGFKKVPLQLGWWHSNDCLK